ncbi:tetratricopeptide repeat protein [Pirellulales bacterium]|nr:tetratricopeptide repeat protein [Pirellulales bacterium]
MTFLRHPLTHAGAFVLATIIAYQPVGRAGFVWDDNSLIHASKLNTADDGLKKIWFSTEPDDYPPITYTLFWIEWHVWGDNPVPYHVLNVLLHATGAILVWRVLLKMNVPGAWWIAMTFALHPVNVASAAWISQQMNTVSLLFAGIAALAYLQFVEQGENRWRWMAAAAFVAAMLSKASVVMLPVVLLGYLWWRRGSIGRDDIIGLAPMFIVAAVLSVVTIYFQSHSAIGSAEREFVRPEGFLSRLAASGWVFWFYVGKTVWPVDLAMAYPRWEVDPGRLLHWLPLVAYLAALTVCWRLQGKVGRGLFFGLGACTAMLFPVTGFFDMSFARFSLVSDHLLYFPMIALLATIVASFYQAACRWDRTVLPSLPVAAAIVLLILAGMTRGRAHTFVSSDALWRDNIRAQEHSWSGYYHLALAKEQERKLDEAIEFHEKALELNPSWFPAAHNLAGCWQAKGDHATALEVYQLAIKLRPHYAMAYHGQGKSLAELGRYDEAVRSYETALEENPDLVRALVNLGLLLTQQGQFDPANDHLVRALELAPDNADVHFFVAGAFYKQKRYDDAENQLKRSLELNPDHALAKQLFALNHKAMNRSE